MKIGSFAKQHKVTVNTVRHYLDLKLLLTKKKNGQFIFDESCSKDLNDVLFLKEMGFSLIEIQQIFKLKRYGMLKSENDINYYIELFNSKKQKLIEEKAELDKSITKIEEEIGRVASSDRADNSVKTKIGFPIDFLSLLSCSICGNPLHIKDGNIHDNMIMNGRLHCKCGYSIKVSDGILLSPFNNVKYFEGFNYEKYCSTDYKKEANLNFMNFLYQSLKWVIGKLHSTTPSPKIILELGTGTGALFKHSHELLAKDTFYIATNSDLNVLKNFKNDIEDNYSFNNVIFICSDFASLPIKDETVDVIVDFFATTRYSYAYDDYLINLLGSKLKAEGEWLGTYFYLDKTAEALKIYPKEYRPYFYSHNICDAFENSPFHEKELTQLGHIDNIGICQEYFKDGDRLYQMVYHGVRK